MYSLLVAHVHTDESVESPRRTLRLVYASSVHKFVNLDIQARQAAREREQRFVHLLRAPHYDVIVWERRERQDKAMKGLRGN